MAVLEWGLLWYDADGPMEDRVRRAAERYEEKHGETPNACFVHASNMETGVIDGCTILVEPRVLKNHFWIGVRDG